MEVYFLQEPAPIMDETSNHKLCFSTLTMSHKKHIENLITSLVFLSGCEYMKGNEKSDLNSILAVFLLTFNFNLLQESLYLHKYLLLTYSLSILTTYSMGLDQYQKRYFTFNFQSRLRYLST